MTKAIATKESTTSTDSYRTCPAVYRLFQFGGFYPFIINSITLQSVTWAGGSPLKAFFDRACDPTPSYECFVIASLCGVTFYPGPALHGSWTQKSQSAQLNSGSCPRWSFFFIASGFSFGTLPTLVNHFVGICRPLLPSRLIAFCSVFNIKVSPQYKFVDVRVGYKWASSVKR